MCALEQPRRANAPRSRRAGFALLVTIVLVAFLVLILIGLATFTRVETQVADNSRQLAQARQNALMALNVAVGQLQKYTGPDQRTTARADIDATLANTTTANGRWLGAYGNGAEIDTAYSLKPSQIPAKITAGSDAKGSQAKLLNWLVSGNENTAFDPSSAVGSDGRILAAPAAFAFTPTSAVNLAAASATPALADVQTLLVGPASAAATSDYVTAPLVKIEAPAGSLPGFDAASANSTLIGRFAWWAGDEGAKARVNLPLASAAQAPAAFVSAQRAGVELMDGKNQTGNTTLTDYIGASAYDPAAASLPRLVALGQFPMISTSASAALSTALRLRYHDLTASSVSVLADAYAGGLKKDLSAVLATGASSPADATYLFTPENGAATDSFGVPNWGQLRSFARTTASSGVLPAPRLATATSTGVAPVLTACALGMKYVAPSGVADGQPIRLAVFPLVVLWNPYTATLPQHSYEVGFVRRFGTLVKTRLEMEDPAVPGTWAVKEDIDFNRNLVSTGGTSNTYIRFQIQLPAGGIPPGASLVLTLPSGGATYNTSLAGQPANTLTNGFNAGGYVLAGSAAFATGESAKNFRASGMMQGGGICAYLGEVASAAVTSDPYIGNAANNYRWHQFVELSPGSLFGSSYWQGPQAAGNFFDQPVAGVLYPTPAFVCEMQMSFGLLPSGQVNYPNVRWMAQTNPRGVIHDGTPGGVNALNFSASSGVQNWHPRTFDSGGLRASSGSSLDSGSAVVDTTLFEYRPDTLPLLSIGQLQHANLAYHSAYPAYAVGNSLADFHFVGMRDQVMRAYTMTVGVDNPPVSQMTSYYDVSWLLNRALWDRYFVSTVPHAGTGTASDTNATAIPAVLANPRHLRHGSPTDADLRDADKAATGLLLAGGFNINSTSEQAWRAVLGGVNQLGYDPVAMAASSTKLPAAFPRFSRPVAASNAASAPYEGYRTLTEEQVARLTRNIVAEIRNRGPFVSLADFVNRRLVDSSAAGSSIDERIKGVLQAALDATVSGSDATNSGASAPFNDAPTYTNTSYGSKYDAQLMQGGSASVAPYSSRSAFAPQMVTQADILSTIGAGLAARSDTFTIRAYGDTVNPVTQDIQARAWCEAVVQRLPEYIDPSATSAEATPAAGGTNQLMGRRYKIVSFRWLSSTDL